MCSRLAGMGRPRGAKAVRWRVLVRLAVTAAAASAAVAGAAPPVAADAAAGHDRLLPAQSDDAAARARDWEVDEDWVVGPPHEPPEPGTRVAALFELRGGGPAVALEARGVDEGARGRWLALEETFRGEGGSRVAVVDFERAWPSAEIRMDARDEGRVGGLSWELLEPRYPDAGANARAAAAERPLSAEDSLDPELADIGVVSRAEWGARPTQCSAPEDDWYRMAIHHTAGPQEWEGTVVGRVQRLQAWSQDSGRFCDIPYQFLVGYDGSLYEGRPSHLQSGATGGENDGNMAVSFLGCYHPSGCAAESHHVTESMVLGGIRLIYTAADHFAIPLDAESVMGHRDYGSSTACPGDRLHPRLGELRGEGEAPYAAAIVDRSWEADDATLTLRAAEVADLWVEFENRGTRAWEPDQTFLAPAAPRDGASALAHEGWPAPERAATVSETTPPGESARFSFSVALDPEDVEDADSALEEPFGLVHQDVTWFSDAPLGGGPGDGAVTLRARAQEGGGAGGSGGDGSGSADVSGGCRSAPASPGGMAALALFSGLVVCARLGFRRALSPPGASR